jgi:hypothetical protein
LFADDTGVLGKNCPKRLRPNLDFRMIGLMSMIEKASNHAHHKNHSSDKRAFWAKIAQNATAL